MSEYIIIEQSTNDIENINNGLSFKNSLHKNKISLALPRVKYLGGDWEIGLKDVYINPNWYNAPCDQHIEIITYSSNEPNLMKKYKLHTPIIKNNRFYNIREIVDKINHELWYLFDNDMDYKTISSYRPKVEIADKFIHIYPGLLKDNTYIFPKFDKYLSQILGYPEVDLDIYISKKYNEYKNYETQIVKSSESYKKDIKSLVSSYPYKEKLINKLYITSDICDDVIYNNNEKPILRVISVENDRKPIKLSYDQPIYIPIVKDNFNTLEIGIFDNITIDKLNDIQKIDYDLLEFTFVLHLRKISDDAIIRDVDQENDPVVYNTKPSTVRREIKEIKI